MIGESYEMTFMSYVDNSVDFGDFFSDCVKMDKKW